jgi:UDP-N-acetylmuramoylalanine-D-glutamate ligase
VVAAARERGLPVLGEVELGWRLLDTTFVAVTGTNGKTTSPSGSGTSCAGRAATWPSRGTSGPR